MMQQRRGKLRLVPPMAQQLEGGQTPLVTAHYLAVDQAGPDLKAVHCLDHKREADRPVVAAAGDQPDAYGITAGIIR